MMVGILERITKRIDLHGAGPDYQVLCAARDEIEGLRAALHKIAKMQRLTDSGFMSSRLVLQRCQNVAYEALTTTEGR